MKRIRKGVAYFTTYAEAQTVAEALPAEYQDKHIRSYGLGYAVQYYTSGPYYPELEDTWIFRGVEFRINDSGITDENGAKYVGWKSASTFRAAQKRSERSTYPCLHCRPGKPCSVCAK